MNDVTVCGSIIVLAVCILSVLVAYQTGRMSQKIELDYWIVQAKYYKRMYESIMNANKDDAKSSSHEYWKQCTIANNNICIHCDGDGWDICTEMPCKFCNGSGKYVESE